jgi:hypothetical protein
MLEPPVKDTRQGVGIVEVVVEGRLEELRVAAVLEREMSAQRLFCGFGCVALSAAEVVLIVRWVSVLVVRLARAA